MERTASKLLAEFIGTGVLVLIGAGSAPAVLLLDKNAGGLTAIELGLVSLAFLAVIVGLAHAIGHISGCHLNPAVTVALAATGRFDWRDVPGYVAAQFAGAVVGAFAIVGVLGSAAARLGLGAASYGSGVGVPRALLTEGIGIAVLTFVVFGVIDKRAAPGWGGVAIAATVFGLVLVLGPATGGAVNPARYLGPMVGAAVFGGDPHWSQLPVYFVAQFAGALVGAAVYVALRQREVRDRAPVPEGAPLPSDA